MSTVRPALARCAWFACDPIGDLSRRLRAACVTFPRVPGASGWVIDAFPVAGESSAMRVVLGFLLAFCVGCAPKSGEAQDAATVPAAAPAPDPKPTPADEPAAPGSEPPKTTEAAAPCPSCSEPRVQPFCHVSSDLQRLQIFIDIRADYVVKKGGKPGRQFTSRTLWDVGCDLGSGKCHGAEFDLTALSTGEPLSIRSMGPMVGATVREFSGEDRFEILWGIRTLTFDAESRTVSLVERSPTIEGRGEAKCD